MNLKQARSLAAEFFKKEENGKMKVAHITSDGKVFHMKALAQPYAESLANKTVIEINRADVAQEMNVAAE